MTQAGQKTLLNNWMGGYASSPGSYDEFVDENGKQRPHWSSTSEHIGSLDKEGWERRERQLARLIHDNGITYNVYNDNASNARPWSMDMLPLAISQKEIAALEVSLGQRAHLLNLILDDVYGRQTMLQSSKMHPYLVFSNPAFLRPCHGLLPPRHNHIQLYAADIARTPDGKWTVVSDRVEAASGLGYALENRMLMSRIFPKAIWQANILSLQPFIQAFCQRIESMAATSAESPNIVLLTSGPKHETYFEQSFLARNLGYTLAEGEDLTVRSNRLYMKTINGVQQVHGVLRRVESSWIDPLELRNESLLGVPGIVNSVRQRNLSMLNALGSGFVETPALLAFLPWFCRNYLGEGLEMPSISTWWCGQKVEQEYVIEHLDSLTIKPTFPQLGLESYYGPKLTGAQKDLLIQKIRRTPERFCGQEIIEKATTPSFRGGKLQPRPYLMRVFLVSDGTSWKIMPGGLARQPVGEEDLTFSMQQGGESKDIWVIRDSVSKQGPRSAAHIQSHKPARRSQTDLPSRTADNMYWLGRYIERAETLARLHRTLTNFLTQDMGAESQRAISPFLQYILPADKSIETLFVKDSERIDFSKVEPFLINSLFGARNSESLINNLRYIERAASKVKERFSIDIWKRMQALRAIADSSSGKQYGILDEDVLLVLDDTLENLAIFVGGSYENMTRSQGWSFLQIGRRIERSLAISSLLQSAYSVAKPYEESLSAQLLNWADSSITYRRRYLNTISSESVMDLLCFDSNNPRSLIYQVETLRVLLTGLPHQTIGHRNPIDTLALQLFSRIGLSSPEKLFPTNTEKRMKAIHSFFTGTFENLLELANKLQEHYFAHTTQTTKTKSTAVIG